MFFASPSAIPAPDWSGGVIRLAPPGAEPDKSAMTRRLNRLQRWPYQHALSRNVVNKPLTELKFFNVSGAFSLARNFKSSEGGSGRKVFPIVDFDVYANVKVL